MQHWSPHACFSLSVSLPRCSQRQYAAQLTAAPCRDGRQWLCMNKAQWVVEQALRTQAESLQIAFTAILAAACVPVRLCSLPSDAGA